METEILFTKNELYDVFGNNVFAVSFYYDILHKTENIGDVHSHFSQAIDKNRESFTVCATQNEDKEIVFLRSRENELALFFVFHKNKKVCFISEVGDVFENKHLYF